ncbi:MAG: hypothetical protein MT490_09495 [Sphingomonas sp.]|uniref:hypothetical protein n=1 Tax=Sphingomonas sp. TaxID=28214 RepID=UPI0022744DFD|nr:hypothetical protein [Sphingomonas sp.]MCX8476016.1 hypothetical protein [Sphingomonas sp.]
MPKLVKSLILGATLLVAPAAIAQETPDAKLAKMLEGRVAGAPVDCISLTQARSSQIVDGKAIVYEVGSRLYVNIPSSGAESLDQDDVLVTKTIGTQLCRMDSVSLVDRTTRFPRGFVLLGKFVPYTKVKAAR